VKGVLEAVAEWTGGRVEDDETLLVIYRKPVADLAAGSAPFSVHDVMALAESYGDPVSRISSLQDLALLRSWIAEHKVLGTLPARSRRRVELGLYEMCANVVEHGYRRSETAELDLWWIPDDLVLAAGRPVQSTGTEPAERVASGFFVLRDHGRPFDPGRGPTPDLGDVAIRRAGRGLGLEMARRILSRLRYYPNTPYGNLTVMRFDHESAAEEEHE
jgi:anti-sigma regulatory factor (Ser/Thr protein kinase)